MNDAKTSDLRRMREIPEKQLTQPELEKPEHTESVQREGKELRKNALFFLSTDFVLLIFSF